MSCTAGGKLYYVGLATNLPQPPETASPRPSQPLRFSFGLPHHWGSPSAGTGNPHPPHRETGQNKVKGKFAKSEDLRRQFRRDMTKLLKRNSTACSIPTDPSGAGEAGQAGGSSTCPGQIRNHPLPHQSPLQEQDHPGCCSARRHHPVRRQHLQLPSLAAAAACVGAPYWLAVLAVSASPRRLSSSTSLN